MAKPTTGTDGDNTFNGGKGPDEIHGGKGNDHLYGNGGNDRLYGDAGDDYLDGGIGDDVLVGNAGNDVLIGGDGTDRLTGWDGNDILDGGNGNDVVEGGAGIDRLTGGAGSDHFIFSHLWDSTAKAANDPVLGNTDGCSVGVDTIVDFNTGQHDQIDIRYVGAIGSTPQLHFSSVAGVGDGANSFWVQYDPATSGHASLNVDKDGDGSADFTLEIFGTFTTLTAGTDIIYQDPPAWYLNV
jgi:Ca2+-binding RTX toxin-like protein